MDINQKSINYLKALAAETVSNAKSGHTGSAISASPILYALFNDHLNFNPKDPEFINRDRFVMSAGHVSALLYSTLHLFGYNITIDDLKKFRTCGSKTAGVSATAAGTTGTQTTGGEVLPTATASKTAAATQKTTGSPALWNRKFSASAAAKGLRYSRSHRGAASAADCDRRLR